MKRYAQLALAIGNLLIALSHFALGEYREGLGYLLAVLTHFAPSLRDYFTTTTEDGGNGEADDH